MALRKLAMLLAKDGFHVLRFDYYATGDSSGHSRDGNLSEWRANIVAAMEDIRECAGTRRISVVGFRLGAALAVAAAIDVVNLVLWEPVISGDAYVEGLRALHRRQYARFLAPPPLPAPGAGGDVLGMPVPAPMEADLRGLDLPRQIRARAQHVALVASDPHQELDALGASFQSQESAPSLEFCPIQAERNRDQRDAMLVSGQVLEAMASVLSRRAA